MNPSLILVIIDGALSLIEKLKPMVSDLFNKGEITIEQQQALSDRIKALSQDDAFGGPEWKPE